MIFQFQGHGDWNVTEKITNCLDFGVTQSTLFWLSIIDSGRSLELRGATGRTWCGVILGPKWIA